MAGYRPSRWVRDKVRKRDQGVCQACGTTAGAIEVAHRIPWPEGPSTEANLYLLCKSCNGKDRRPWGTEPVVNVHDFPQSQAEFHAIVDELLERVLPV